MCLIVIYDLYLLNLIYFVCFLGFPIFFGLCKTRISWEYGVEIITTCSSDLVNSFNS